MLERTAATRSAHGDRLSTELFDLADMEWRNGLAGARVVYSSLAIHHLDGPGKRRLFKDVYRMLEKGGVSSWRI